MNGPTLASVPITVNAGATPGPRSVTLATGSEKASTLTNGFTVLPGASAITVIDPNAGRTDQNVAVSVSAQFTNFQNGVTVASFGPGVSVGGAADGALGPVSVSSPTTFTASLAINVAATLGPRDVVVQTGTEQLTVPQGFTITTIDTTPPGIVSVSPAYGATGVPLNTEIVVRFSEPIDRSTITAASFVLRDNVTSTNVPGTVSVDVTGRVATFVPSRLLGVARSHTVTLSASDVIRDTSGNALSFTQPSIFTTGFETSTAGPTLISSSSRWRRWRSAQCEGSPLVHTRCEPRHATCRHSRYHRRILRPGSYTFSDGNQLVAFQPASALVANSTYVFTLTTQLTDSAGNPLTNPGAFTFATGSTFDFTGPTVVASSPGAGASGVGRNAVVRVVFGERVNPLTVTDNFVLTHSGTGQVQAATVTVAADRLSATLTPVTALLPSTTYRVQLFSYTDLAGNFGSGLNQTFTTAADVDTVGPTVAAMAPAAGATNVPVNARVVVRLSEPIDATSVTAGVVMLAPAVAGTVTLASDRVTVTFVPGAALGTATSYTVTVSGLRDVTGNVMTPFTRAFTTAAISTADTTPPTVLSVVPVNNATNVPVTTTITATLSEPITAGAVDAVSMPVMIAGTGTQLAGTYTVTAAATAIVFTPVAPLPGSTVIQVLVNSLGTITDLAGNTLSFASSRFTTAAAADTTAPVVTSVTPAEGSTEVGLNTTVVVTFSEPLNPATVNNTTFALFGGATLLSTSVNRSADNRTVFLTTTLPPLSLITVVATGGVTDLSGNALADYASQFVTGAGSTRRRRSW